MSSRVPSLEVMQAIEAGLTKVTRRVELYESDGATPYYPNRSEEDLFRLISGNVSIDSSRSERRSLDILLSNSDNNLRPNADDGFWYDKIIRPFRGIRYPSSTKPPAVLIVEDNLGVSGAASMRVLLIDLGFQDVSIKLDASSLADLSGYKVILSATRNTVPTKSQLLHDAYAAGYSVFTFEYGAASSIPYGFTTSSFIYDNTGGNVLIQVPGYNTPLAGGWSTESEGTIPSGQTATAASGALIDGVVAVASSLNDSTSHYTAMLKENLNGKWFTYRAPSIGTQARNLWRNALMWAWDYEAYKEWETPLGDFLIDTIQTENFPKTVSVSARDQTKKCLGSKLEKNMAWEVGTPVNELITALAANAGISKIKLDSSNNTTLGKRIDVTRNTERWAVMTDAAAYKNRQLFFDVDGYLIDHPYADPALGAPSVGFAAKKNLVSYNRSTSDARIYNHIIVTGTPPTPDGVEDTGLEYFGEALNDNPVSPSSISRLGDRTYFYTSAFFSSNQQCIDYANTLIKQTAFEQYEIGFQSLVYPWLDAGSVIDFLDPDNNDGDPTRFLMDTLTIPLGLEAMSGSGKRVLFIASESEAA